MSKKSKKIEKSEEKQIVINKITSPTKISFDAWYYSSKIPKHHYKEIIYADFCARGLTEKETREVYNKALKEYGLKI